MCIEVGDRKGGVGIIGFGGEGGDYGILLFVFI